MWYITPACVTNRLGENRGSRRYTGPSGLAVDEERETGAADKYAPANAISLLLLTSFFYKLRSFSCYWTARFTCKAPEETEEQHFWLLTPLLRSYVRVSHRWNFRSCEMFMINLKNTKLERGVWYGEGLSNQTLHPRSYKFWRAWNILHKFWFPDYQFNSPRQNSQTKKQGFCIHLILQSQILPPFG